MIEGIYQIGSIVKQGKRISEIASDIPQLKEDIKYKVGVINFSLDKEIIEIDTRKEYELGDEDKFKYIKLGLTGRQNQFFCTFTDLKRLQCEEGKEYSCWLSIKEEIQKLSTNEVRNFLKTLQRVKGTFYSGRTLDLSKIRIFNGGSVEGFEDEKEFKQFLKRQLGRNEDIIFWTIEINGKKIVDCNFYDELIKKKVIDEKKREGKAVCYMCGEEKKEYLEDFARFPIKFFINDKVGFSQKLSDRWEGNFALCVSCYISVFAGQKFVLNNLKFSVGGVIDVLLIPEFVGKVPFAQDKLKEWADLIRDLYNPFKFFEEDELKGKLERYRRRGYLKNFLLNYIFYELNNQQFKIYSVVKDLPSSRIDELRRKFNKYRFKVLEQGLEPLKSYGSVYTLIPLRHSQSDRKIIDKSKISETFSSILEGIPVNKNFLVREFWIGAMARYFSNTSYFGIKDMSKQEDKDKAMWQYILKTHQLLILLKELPLLNTRRVEMDLSKIPEKLQMYIEEVGFNEQETALFLLGTLIGDIGSKQIKYGSKPILNKINYQGMSLGRLEILFNEVHEKLKHEKLLFPEEELIYETANYLFNKNLKNWNLKPYENVYYLLSGYAYKTALNIKGKEV